MKLKLTEQQAKKLVSKLGVTNLLDDADFENSAPNLSKLAKALSSNVPNTDFNINDTNVSNSNLPTNDFAKNIPLGNSPMHPLGHKTKITSSFGIRNSSIGSNNHKGVDLSTPSGSPVYAPLDGIVIASRDTSPNACGGFVKLDHTNVITKFCHLRQLAVKEGVKVKKGQVIGYSGGGSNDPMRGTSTGPHLHYEILNKSTNLAMNPLTTQTNLA